MTKSLTEQQIRKIIENVTWKSSKVCEQKFYDKPKSLTEQWKDGELDVGYYYIDFGIGGVPMLFNGIEFYCERTQKPNAIKTILAPVLSYSEYIELMEMNKNQALTIHNLQEQLAEANEVIKEYSHDDFYTKGGGRYENPNPFFAREYLKKWGIPSEKCKEQGDFPSKKCKEVK